jgi:hypothetical protein
MQLYLHSSCMLSGQLYLFVEAKLSLAGPGRPLGLKEFETPRFSRQSAYEDENVVNSIHRQPLPLREIPWFHFC